MAWKLFSLKKRRRLPTFVVVILAALMKLYALTVRVKFVTPTGAPLESAADSPAVFAIWHNRIISAVLKLPRCVLERCTAMISASRDGEYISAIARCFGLDCVRGSSSRGGAKALVELAHVVKASKCPVLTVDGPRGPKYTVHPGAVALAKLCGVPLYPIAVNARRCWQLKSWDSMQVPWPFSKVEVVLGDPIQICQGTPDGEANDILRAGLLKITLDRGKPVTESHDE